MTLGSQFTEAYKKLNPAQKEAVDTIDGPVMVVAGPGTGKTQVLALRIANILQKTDTKAPDVLCLTFTNAAVEAMKNRLEKYIGGAGEGVNISTFHSFGMKLIEEYYSVLKLKEKPRLMDDVEMVTFYDELLFSRDFEYLRPRANASRYFKDLRSLISLLKRKNISARELALELKREIKNVKNDENNISTRGKNKGEIKKEVQNKIEGFKRSEEFAEFFELYEATKAERNLFDYDDVLEGLVKISEKSKSFCADIREKFLYILIDEHQDSSGVQNIFLEKVWGEVEKPNIFVVGDDRQLIYGFGGASISHFKKFTKVFEGAKLITLSENYRSTKNILNISDVLLKSALSQEKLVSHHEENHPIRLVEAQTKEEEIIACGLDLKSRLQGVVDPRLMSGEKISAKGGPASGGKNFNINDCAILVPKNREVRKAALLLVNMGIPVAPGEHFNFFESEEGAALIRVLKIINNPEDNVSLALSLFDGISGISTLLAHKFLVAHDMRRFSLLDSRKENSLFKKNEVEVWLAKLISYIEKSKNMDLTEIVEMAGDEFSREITHTLLELIKIEKSRLEAEDPRLISGEKNSQLNLGGFLTLLGKLEDYGEAIPIKSLEDRKGVKIMTLHGSKGLEFDYVWVAHMDEKSLTSERRQGLALPESIMDVIAERDEDVVKRELYVAITRTKRFCTISYTGELANIIQALPKELLNYEKAKKLKAISQKLDQGMTREDLIKIAKGQYKNKYISASLLNTFFECPRKWYFRNLLGLPEEKNESLEFGSKVHEAINQILKSNKAILPKDKEVSRVIERWIKNRLPEIAPDRESEKSISTKDAKFPHLNIYGKIDLVEKLDSGGVRVTDFKTGSVRKKSEIEKMDEEGRMSNNLRQLTMYSYLLTNNSKINVRESRLEFLEAKNPKESIYNHVVTPEEIELLIKDIADYDELVKSGKWVERECHYNSYGKNTECEYCKMAEIYG